MHKVSIVTPTYKRAPKLKRAIDSCLNQTHENIEIIVVDDNNPKTKYREATEKIMEEYRENNKVKYIKHSRNKNGSAARNTGISNSSGEFIAFLDDDDYFFETKIKDQLEFLVNNKQYDAVYCGFKCGEKLVVPKKSGNLLFEQFFGSNIIDTNLLMMKKEALLKIECWDERLNRNQDTSLMIKYFAEGYQIGVISDVLVEIDLSDRSNVANPIKNEENFNKFFEYYSQYMEALTKKQQKQIIASRYRGVCLRYLKSKDVKNTVRIYLKYTLNYPFYFNWFFIFVSIKNNVFGRDIYGYK